MLEEDNAEADTIPPKTGGVVSAGGNEGRVVADFSTVFASLFPASSFARATK